jgi:hypothetical protein
LIESKESIPDKVTKGTVPVLERLSSLNKDQLHTILATALDGQPYTSVIAYALTPDTKGIVFATPGKTWKDISILKNSRGSLLIDTRSNTERDYMGAESLTILGNAMSVRKGGKWSELAGALIQIHQS